MEMIIKKYWSLKNLAAQIERELIESATPLSPEDYEYADARVVIDGDGNIIDGFHRVAGLLCYPGASDEIEVIVCEDGRLAGYAAAPEWPDLQAAALALIHDAARAR